MDISSEQLTEMLKQAAQQAIEELLADPKKYRKMLREEGVLIQIRRMPLIIFLLKELGVSTIPKRKAELAVGEAKLSTHMRDALEEGVSEFGRLSPDPTTPAKRINFRIQKALLNRAKETGAEVTDLVLLGLLKKVVEKNR